MVVDVGVCGIDHEAKTEKDEKDDAANGSIHLRESIVKE
jgi:hypothetical protein